MAILIGVDEAGYGPNLGPLVVAATTWRLAGDLDVDSENGLARARRAGGKAAQGQRSLFEFDALTNGGVATSERMEQLSGINLYDRLADAVTAQPHAGDDRLAIADSKVLYKPGGGLRLLERGVLTTAQIASESRSQSSPCAWSELVARTKSDVDMRQAELPWYEGFDCALPLDASQEEMEELPPRLRDACLDNKIELVAIDAQLVFPELFNGLIEQHGTKGAALSHVTLQLVRRAVDRSLLADRGDFSADPCIIALDKHGGRNRYTELLQHAFPKSCIETIVESRSESRYQWQCDGRPLEASFRAGGEAQLQTALASMTAKYLRELAMRAFNAFWMQRVPELRPTAGYPVDAKRFRAEIAQVQQSLGIKERVLWRCR